MPSIAVALPLFVFMTLYVILLARGARRPDEDDAWRHALVQACVVWGALLALFSEALSLFGALTPSGVGACWGVALLLGFVFAWRDASWPAAIAWLRHRTWRLQPVEAVTMVGLACIVLLLAAVAWMSPPNTTDSHLYHMARVVHWAQNRSLAHYPTTYEHQLWFPTWAETAILTFRLLWGSDQPAGLVQWFSMAASLVVVSGIARLLGAGRRGQLLAAAFAASVPMGILQSTSTQNDYVLAFWFVCLAYLVLLAWRRPLSRVETACVGLAWGLGLLTKGTFYVSSVPLLVWYLGTSWKRGGFPGLVRQAAGLAFLVVALNLGFWLRNWLTYGGPLGPGELLQGVTNVLSVAAWPFSWVAHLLSHFATPSEPVNAWLAQGFQRLASATGASFPDFHLIWSWNHEDLAGSPLHLLAIGLAVLAYARPGFSQRSPIVGGYLWTGLVSFSLTAVLVTWNPFVVRLHLPFLIAAAPFAGWRAERALRGRLTALAGLGLLVLSLPWVLLNQTRPVVGLRPRTAIVSVFRADQVDVLFANRLPLRDDFIAATGAIRETGCRDVGLRIDSHDLEYPIWWLLSAPQSGIRIEHLDPYPHLVRYVDPTFRPCAILCTTCGGRTRLHGLERVAGYGDLTVFVGEGFTTEE